MPGCPGNARAMPGTGPRPRRRASVRGQGRADGALAVAAPWTSSRIVARASTAWDTPAELEVGSDAAGDSGAGGRWPPDWPSPLTARRAGGRHVAAGVRAGLWRARGAFQTQSRVMPLWGVIGVLAVDPGDASQQRIGKAIWGPAGGRCRTPLGRNAPRLYSCDLRCGPKWALWQEWRPLIMQGQWNN